MFSTKFTDRIAIGRKPLMVSPICLGITPYPEFVLEAFDAGINFFFLTADMHWPLYESTRKGIAMLLKRVPREEIVIAGAAYVSVLEFTAAPFSEITDCVEGMVGVDIFISGGSYERDIHPDARVGVFRQRVETPDVWAKMASTIVSASGATFHSRPAALEAINNDLLDIAFVRHNAKNCIGHLDLFPHINPAHKAKVFNFKSCQGFVPKGFLAEQGETDVWEPELEDHYRMVLSEPNVDGVLCSPSSFEQLMLIRDAIAKGPMSTEDIEHMMALAQYYYHKQPPGPPSESDEQEGEK